MNYGICHLSAIPLRTEPSDQSELCHQLLFGDTYEILEEQDDWTRIRVTFDYYKGWIYNKQLQPISEDKYNDWQSSPDLILTSLIQRAQSDTRTLWLPFGATLPEYKEEQFQFLGETFTLSESEIHLPHESDPKQKNLQHWALQFLHVPYLWGGRTPFGIDCSGFTQVLFRAFGISLPRDTRQQYEQGNQVDFGEHQTGDLAFCKKNPDDDINHVGIVFPNEQIIHASGQVRIDTLDEKGILNPDTGEYSHHLVALKRYF